MDIAIDAFLRPATRISPETLLSWKSRKARPKEQREFQKLSYFTFRGGKEVRITSPLSNWGYVARVYENAISKFKTDSVFRESVLGDSGISLNVAKQANRVFEVDKPSELVKYFRSLLPDVKDFYDDEFVLLPEEKLLIVRATIRNGKARTDDWRVVPLFGDEFSFGEARDFERNFGVRFKLYPMEDYGHPLTRRNVRRDGPRDNPIQNLPDPVTALQRVIVLPNGTEVGLRSRAGNPIWAAIPRDCISLSEDEVADVAAFLERNLKNNFPEVEPDDLVCWGNIADKHFMGNITSVVGPAIKAKLPDPLAFSENAFTPEKFPRLTYRKKVTPRGDLVWVENKTKHKLVARHLELQRKGFTSRVPKNAIICSGPGARDFWVEADDHLEPFTKRINDSIINPYGLDDPFVLVISHDEDGRKIECRVFLGENINTKERRCSRFLYVKRPEEAAAFAEITGFTPKRRYVRAKKDLSIGIPDDCPVLDFAKGDLRFLGVSRSKHTKFVGTGHPHSIS